MAISILAIVGLLVASLLSLDTQAQQNLKDRVAVALAVETNRQEAAMLEYSFWDEAHVNLIQAPNEEWAESNIGIYLAESYGIDMSVALRSDMSGTFLYEEGELVDPPELDGLSIELASLLEIAQSLTEESYIASGYRTLQGFPYLVTVGLFLDEDNEVPVGDGSFLLFAQRLDVNYLAEVGETYEIAGLWPVDTPTIGALNHLELRSDDALVLDLTWEESRAISDSFARLLLPVVLVLLVLVVMTSVLLRRYRLGQQRYTDQLLNMATKDSLTGISNRREFFYLANREMARSKRTENPLSLLMLDIDHFKAINDNRGHAVGDQVLAGIASLVEDGLRDIDVFARVGGEEFVVLLVDTNGGEAKGVAERLCETVRDFRFAASEGESVHCTVSIGLAIWDDVESIDKLLNRADDALYAAKRNGRDQVQVAVFS